MGVVFSQCDRYYDQHSHNSEMVCDVGSERRGCEKQSMLFGRLVLMSSKYYVSRYTRSTTDKILPLHPLTFSHVHTQLINVVLLAKNIKNHLLSDHLICLSIYRG